jgi:hypothetical protein
MCLDSRRVLPYLVLLAVFWEAVAVRATSGFIDAVLLTAAIALLVGSHALRRRARQQLFVPARAHEEVMSPMLNHSEQRRLKAIERSLEQDDPELAERLRIAAWTTPAGQGSRYLTTIAVGGLVLALVGLLLGPALIFLGLSFAVAGFWLRLVLNWSTGPDQHDGANGPDSSR